MPFSKNISHFFLTKSLRKVEQQTINIPWQKQGLHVKDKAADFINQMNGREGQSLL